MSEPKSDLLVPVSERDHVRGPAAAVHSLVEYGDFDCPFCRGAYPIVRELLSRFTADVRFVFRYNPRGDLHEHALVAARAAEAAALHGRFWEMHDRLFEHPHALTEQDMPAHAAAIGLDAAAFEVDFHSARVLERVREDEVGGLRSGVIGTPTFFVDGRHFRDKPDMPTLTQALLAAGAKEHRGA
jgi:protein-disulfide isomerase